MTRNVLAIVAHADDEALGCAGTLARHSDAGDRVHVIFVADGVGAREAGMAPDPDDLAARKAAACQAVQILGGQKPLFLDLPDNQLDTLPLLSVIKAIHAAASPLVPQVIYTHHSGDLNIDHRIVAEAVLTAFRPQPDDCVAEIYGFENLSSTEWRFGAGANAFLPQKFVNITATLQRKLAALEAYAMEMRSAPHARSYQTVRALAQYRGGSVGVDAAEAFHIYRQIEV
ncbi:PIG-L deacetylase family protein [Pseudorhodobacter sp.]|uniref:PIG-L deacetylase family protein n=1 Tax=Pseudorhodobacter sp. TaxID=1934400 RepID=UPI00264A271C|nr:PIG-L family deacetylase [Pseudorhodobacter sp.]MDN5787605.1 PIG-L family deacetylase [Pseudorhodobacter sp.]